MLTLLLLLLLQNLGTHPEYVSPLSAHGASGMPPPAARPRAGSLGGGGGGGGGARSSSGALKQRKGPTVRGAAAAGGGGGRLGQPPWPQGMLDARLAVADLSEMENMLMAISRRERAIMAELEAAGFNDEELSRSIMERDQLARQLQAAH